MYVLTNLLESNTCGLSRVVYKPLAISSYNLTESQLGSTAPTPITFLQEAGYILAFAKSPYLSTSPSLPAAATIIIPLEVTELTTLLKIFISSSEGVPIEPMLILHTSQPSS